MKRIVLMCCVLLLGAGLCFAADPLEGFWISVDENTNKITAGWEIYVQDGKLYGKILSLADFSQDELAGGCKESYKGFPLPGKVNQMKVIGPPWIFGLKEDKSGQWSGGNVIDPQDGKLYGCKVTFRPADGKKFPVDALEMRGTIGPFGRSQFWKKSTQEEASGLR
jgi:uncharacterized protein (DUF2147 family)